MGKRKHSKDSYDYIAKKLKKLERKLNRKRERERDRSPTYGNEFLSSDNEDDTTSEGSLIPVDMDLEITEPAQTTSAEPIPTTSVECIEIEPAPSADASAAVPEQEAQVQDPAPIPEIDNVIFDLLGDDPSVTQSYGKEINSDLAIRLQHIATTGLSKEMRKDLQVKYLPPSNCAHIDAPLLNPEIKAAVTEIVVKRDKGIEIKQKELGSAISCIGEAVSILLAEQNKNTSVIKLLMDACRLICDCQNTDSVTRRNFILYNLKKDMKEQMRKTKIDTLLFGSDLAETLKTAKSISKSGADLKSVPAPKPSQNTRQPTTSTTPRNNLNWKAPPPTRRPKGTPRMKEPAQNSQHASSSRPSYRAQPQPPTASRRGRR